MFSAFSAKIHHWFQFTKFCFSERGFQVKEARELTKLGMSAIRLFPRSSRDDFALEHLEPFVAHILGVYYTAIGHHDAVQVLALAGHSLDSMILLRSQLEAILAFFYVTEPQTDLHEVFLRTDKYRDWVVVKMKQNMDRSSKLSLLRVVENDGFESTVRDNYEIIKDKYSSSRSDFAQLERSNSFLTAAQRENLAKAFHIEELYQHIYAESSASIHFADIGDRMREIEPLRYHYTIRYKHGAFWFVMLSNLLQFHCIKQFGIFFGIETIVTPKLEAIFVS